MTEDDGEAEARRLVGSQRTYYDLRAPDYADPDAPPDRTTPGEMPSELARQLIDELAPVGDVLELACGTGGFTSELIRHAGSLTAVDASPTMLERNEALVGPGVSRVCADLFGWQPTDTYDLVFFGFWLSHVPPSLFPEFWTTVRSCLKPGGRAAFIDEDTRAEAKERSRSDDGVPAAQRRLRDGRTFDIVKVFWDPPDLEEQLRGLGWRAEVRSVGDSFYFGTARPTA